MSTPNGMDHDPLRAAQEWPYSTQSSATPQTRQAGHEPGTDEGVHGAHGGHGWMMIVCCIPMLAIAGLLNLDDIGGPSVKPYQPAGYYEALQFPSRDYVSETGERQWRRGVYTHWQRTFLHPMMANFDAPARDECAAARTDSNTPQQALTLLNDPAFVEAARVFAARILKESGSSETSGRLSFAYRAALNREPKEQEATSLAAFLKEQQTYFTAHPDEASKLIVTGIAPAASLASAEHAAWTQLARVLLNTHESITRY